MPVKRSEYRANTEAVRQERKQLWEAQQQELLKKDPNYYNNKTVGSTVGLLGGKLASGLASVFEGIADAGAAGFKGLGKATSWLVDNPVGEFIFGEDAGDYKNNPLWQLGDSMTRDEITNELNKAVEDSFAEKSYADKDGLASNIAQGAGQVIGAALTGKMMGSPFTKPVATKSKVINTIGNAITNPGMQSLFLSTAGNSYTKASNEGASDLEATAYGLLNASKEFGTEMMYGGLGKVFGKGALDDVVGSYVSSMFKSKIGQAASKLGVGMVAEGLEEVASSLLEPFTSYVYKHDLDFSSYQTLMDDFISGALVSGIVQGGQLSTDLIKNAKQKKAVQDIMSEYNRSSIEKNNSNIEKYSKYKQDILNKINQSNDPGEIVTLKNASDSVTKHIDSLKVDNQKKQQDLDVLKIVPQTETKKTTSKKTSIEKKTANATKQEKVKTVETKFTPDEQYAINKWAGSESYLINDSLRRGVEIPSNHNGVDLQKVSENLSKAIKKAPVYEGTVYRSIDLSGEDLTDFLNRYKEGAVVTEKPFTSAGVGQIYDDSWNIQLEIDSHTARDTTELFRKSEKEVLFDKNSSFKVLSVDASDLDNIKIKLEDVTKKSTETTKTENKASSSQIKAIHALLNQNKDLKNEIYEQFGVKSSKNLTVEQANEMIKQLKKVDSMSEKIESTIENNKQKVEMNEVATENEIKGVASKEILDQMKDKSVKKTNNISDTYLQQHLLDTAFAIDQLADKLDNKNQARNLKAANDRRFSAVTITTYQISEGQTNLKTGEKIGDSVDAILRPFVKNNLLPEFEAYVYIKSNLERGKYGKDNKGVELTKKQQKDFIAEMDKKHPEFKIGQQKVNKYYRNLLQNEVGGRVSEQLAEYLTDKYKDYARFYNEEGNQIFIKGDRITVGPAVKQATGGKYKLMTLREAMVKATHASVNGVLDNNLRLELLKTLGGTQLMVNQNYKPILDTSDGYKLVAYKDGVPYAVTVSKGIVDAMQLPGITDVETALHKYLKYPEKIAKFYRNILTDFNPLFTLYRNPIRDIQDAVVNSKHAARTIKNIPRAYTEILMNGEIAQRFKAMGGYSSSYFDYDGKKQNPIKSRISALNQAIEQAPRLAEFMASVESGSTAEQALLDAAEVTTNFKRGGSFVKALNRNGFMFLNSSVAGMYKHYKNLKGANGVRGYVNLLAKTVGAGIAIAAVNNLLYSDDEEYQNLPDYIKDSYYLFKVNDKFVKIPKGRVVSIFDKAARNVFDIIKGRDNQFHGLKLIQYAYDQAGPNNPVKENFLSPIFQAINNEKWTGVPIDNVYESDKSGSGYKLPKDRKSKNTTVIAEFLSSLIPEEFNVSPKKIDYVIDQYGGFYYDLIKPSLTNAEEWESTLENPLASNMLVDTVYNNDNVSKAFDLVGPLAAKAKANEDDVEAQFQYKYVNSQVLQMKMLYGEINKYNQEDTKDKAAKTRELTKQINDIANETMKNYKSIKVDSVDFDGTTYYVMNGSAYTKNEDGDYIKSRSAVGKSIASGSGPKEITYGGQTYYMIDGIAYKYNKNGVLRKCTSNVCKNILNQ